MVSIRFLPCRGRRALALCALTFAAFLLAHFPVLSGAAYASTPADAPAVVEKTTTVTSMTSSSTPSSSSVTTSSTLLSEYPNDLLLSVHPKRPIASLTLHVRAKPDSGIDDADCTDFSGPGAPVGFSGVSTLDFTDLPRGRLDRSQQFARCTYFTQERHGPLSAGDFSIPTLSAKDASGEPVDVAICATDFRADGLLIPGPDKCRKACGDAVCDGGPPTAQDALAVLRTAVGLRLCPPNLCDANASGDVRTTDALAVLKRAVGLPVNLLCLPAPCVLLRTTY
jgi:hypothetical protein